MTASKTLAAIAGAAAVIAVERLLAGEAALVRMVAITGTLFLAVKAIVLAGSDLPPLRKLAFVCWFGMRPEEFARSIPPDTDGGRALIAKGLGSTATGALLLFAAHHLEQRFLATLIAFLALSLLLHFGLFDIVAGLYRRRGIPVRKLFRAPLRARGLAEFWGRRWNTGFSEMIALLVDRPLRHRVRPPIALFASFLASGLLHELAISVPVRAGYGLPTAYFLLHGALVAYEKRSRRAMGRVWTLFWLAAPVPLVFHPPFVREVVWPLAGIG